MNYLGSWVNKYRKGDHQEVHNHADLNCNLVMVYVYKSQNNNCFKFYDPDCYEHKFRLDNCFNFLYSPKITPNLNNWRYDYISILLSPHGVTKQK